VDDSGLTVISTAVSPYDDDHGYVVKSAGARGCRGLLSAPFPAGAGPGPLGRGRACLVQVGHTLRLTDLDQASAVWWPLMRAMRARTAGHPGATWGQGRQPWPPEAIPSVGSEILPAGGIARPF